MSVRLFTPFGTGAVTSEISYVQPYSCPRCRADLAAQPENTAVWLRCPECQRASLPPAQVIYVARPRPSRPEEITYLGEGEDQDFSHLTPLPRPKHSLSIWRIAMATGLFVSVIALGYALYEQSPLNASIAGFITIVFLGLLTFPTKPQSH